VSSNLAGRANSINYLAWVLMQPPHPAVREMSA